MESDSDEREVARRRSVRQLSLALAFGALALPGMIAVERPGVAAEPDPLALLVWLALVAPAAGCAAAAAGVAGWSYTAAVPGLWSIVLVIVDGRSERDLPTPLWGACALGGAFLLGHAAGTWCRARSLAAAAVLALGALALACAPFAAGRIGSPWPPGIASGLLDLSPATLAAECAGVDWMRTPVIYDAVATDRFERSAWSGALAGPAALLLGCAARALSSRAAARGARPSAA
jgi:hypothetical protein